MARIIPFAGYGKRLSRPLPGGGCQIDLRNILLVGQARLQDEWDRLVNSRSEITAEIGQAFADGFDAYEESLQAIDEGEASMNPVTAVDINWAGPDASRP